MIIIKKLIRYYCTFFAKKQVLTYGENFTVNFPSKFTKKTLIGNNCHFNGITILGVGNVKIGNNFHSGKKCTIMTTYHNYDKGTKIPYDESYISKDVQIQDNVWIGSGVLILAGVRIEEGCIIQANSVVTTNIPYCAIAGGHPAKVFKMRDIKHYEDLKSKKLFH